MEFMYENSNPELRSGKDNEIQKTECITEDNDTLMYLVNFEDGYALVSGSSAIYPILGFADQNNLYEDDINNNSDLSFWFEYVKGQIKETLNDTIIEYYDPLGWEDITDYSQTRIGVGESGRITGRVGEELCLIKTNWHQGPPFNNSTPYVGSNYSNGNAPAGCVAIAIGQILFYHKKMANYNDWNKLADPVLYPETMGQFIKTIGTGVSMVYGKDGSHPKILTKVDMYPGPKDFFESVGYKVKSSNFSLAEIAYQLDKKNPVYISGYKDSDILNAPNLFKGHAWVCDAYVKRVLENNRNERSSGSGGRGTRASSDNTAYDYPPSRNDNSPESTDPMYSNRYPRLLKTLSVEKK